MTGGRVEPGYEAVRDAFVAGHPVAAGGGQLCVYRRGKPVVDLWIAPFAEDSLTVLMSCTKGAVAVLVHMLAERGELSLTAPIAEVWPEFAAEGKEGITLAHVLTHSSGLFGWDPDAGTTGATALDWSAATAAHAAMRPFWAPGTAYLYHFISFGFLVGEVVRRATGKTVGALFAEHVAGPLGLDLWIGLPEAEDHRVVSHVRSGPPFAAEVLNATFAAMGLDTNDRLIRGLVGTMVATDELIDLMNTRPGRAAKCLPATASATPALARMYAATIGEVDGIRLLAPDTVEAIRTPRTDGLKAPPPFPMIGDDPQRFGLGFELARRHVPMAGPGSFGHPGAGGCLAFADPETGLAVGYACNAMLWDGRNPDPRWGWMTALRTSPMLDLKDPALLRGQSYVNGKWVGAAAGATFPVTNPATGEVLAQVANLDDADARAAIEAAYAALPAWRARTAKDRAALMRRWYELIMANQEDLARLMTAEQGKPLAETRGEVSYGASFIEWFAEEGKRLYGDIIPTHSPGKRVLVMREPVGVVAAVTPWNFPNAMITRKAAPALAAGCTFLIKPASETPLSATALAELADQAGIPPGVFNVVTSKQSSKVGREFTQHPLVRKFTFTGSTEIGKVLMAQCATTVKKVSLELGGNAPFIVFEDADLDAAADGAMISKYRNMGQTCVCANRILVQDGVRDAFAAKLAERVAKMVVGDGATAGVTQGPLINAEAVEKVERLLAEATAAGAEVVAGGRRHALGGSYFEPTIVTGVTQAMTIAREEIFGPVATLFRFKDEAEAIRIANDTEFGLAAYFYTRDLGRAFRVAEALEYGIIGLNEGIISTETAPFGGMKESGIGREGSKYGIEDFLETKYVLVGGIGAP